MKIGTDGAHGAVACFGEILLRLSTPAHALMSQATKLEMGFGGAEANVAVALASLGHETRMLSVLPTGPLGDAALDSLRARGVDTRRIARADGRLGAYYVVSGGSLRPSEIVYDRLGSAFAEARAGDYDWAALLQGATLLHLSGITPALGPNGAQAALAAARAAKAAGITVSFDGNYRARLWDRWDGKPRETLTALVGEADIFFGNHRDIALLLDRPFSGDGEDRRREAALAAFAAFPNLKRIASTARHVEQFDAHRIAARLDTPGEAFQTREVRVSAIVDRIGGGDAFAAGVLHELIRSGDDSKAVEAGLALTCLKHSLPGDAALFSQKDLDSFAAGELDVRR
ncbi:sugar kinase [Sphingomonas sp. LY54]|uniref:sugar kinase n=1 Tax=Sphingomonas sp. LY54 TaxID=3095343 RepID=UPI002D792AD9|nr:sugar kinase [Sphingomonas sp. LY54]WRP28381.1 sugar kinase [Sphingomonas sp. LY54]